MASLSFFWIHSLWCVSELFLVCRFTYYNVYLVQFEISKTSYIYERREYLLGVYNLARNVECQTNIYSIRLEI
jgi:hypothetical protein